jgi:hypothetical protein
MLRLMFKEGKMMVRLMYREGYDDQADVQRRVCIQVFRLMYQVVQNSQADVQIWV